MTEPTDIPIDPANPLGLPQDPSLTIVREDGDIPRIKVTWPNGRPERLTMTTELFEQWVADRDDLIEIALTALHAWLDSQSGHATDPARLARLEELRAKHGIV